MGRFFWLRLTTASEQCLRRSPLSAVFHLFFFNFDMNFGMAAGMCDTITYFDADPEHDVDTGTFSQIIFFTI